MPKPADLLLCVECDEVYTVDRDTCPACCCTSAIPLSRLTSDPMALAAAELLPVRDPELTA